MLILQKIYIWLKSHWIWPLLGIAAIILFVLFRKNNIAISSLLQSQENYRQQIATLEKLQQEAKKRKEEIQQKYNDIINEIERKYQEDNKILEENKKKEIKRLVEEFNDNPERMTEELKKLL